MDAEFFLRASTLETILEGGKKWGGKGTRGMRPDGRIIPSKGLKLVADELRRREQAQEQEQLRHVDVEVIE